MQKISKENSSIRIEDSLEFLDSAKDNLLKSRFKATIDHSITACIAANDAFTISLLGKIANMSHYEAIDLHQDAALSLKENKKILLKELLNERHKITYRPIKATECMAKLNLKKANEFIAWIRQNIH